MQGLVTVFGGSGFVGGQVVRALAKRGMRVRVAVRRPWRAYRLRLLGDVGQIEIVQASLRAPASVSRALEGAEGCVNAVGVVQEIGRQKFHSLHAMGAQVVAEAARDQGVQRLAHISAIGADANSPAKYARTKGLGEAAVHEAFPSATILRPSIVFGPEDHFFNRFAALAAISPVLPLLGGGHTRFQPVFVADLARAVAAALVSPDAPGKTYELGGPGIYTFKALMQLILRETGRSRPLLPIPWALADLIGAAGDLTAALPVLAEPIFASPIAPPTSDQVTMLRVDNVVAPGALGLADLGVEATALEPIIPTYLYRYRKGGQYADLSPAVATPGY